MSNFLQSLGQGIALKFFALVVAGAAVAVLVPLLGEDAAGGTVFALLWVLVIVRWIVGAWRRRQERLFEKALANSLNAIPAEILPIVRRVAGLQPVTVFERLAAAQHYEAHPETHLGWQALFSETRRLYINDQAETLIQELVDGKQLPKGKIAGLRQYFDLYPGARDYLVRADRVGSAAVEKALQAR